MRTVNSKLKIVVLAGGIGTEREISLQSGQCVADALTEVGHEVILADIAPNKLDVLDKPGVDVFFIAMHGEFGEDGQIQQILEDRNLCYTGSNSAASRIAIDKIESKKYFAGEGVLVPDSVEYTWETTVDEVEKLLLTSDSKLVVKPVSHGSSIGVEIIEGAKAATAAARVCLEQFGDCMIEQFIVGREITVGILNGRPLPVIEIKPEVGFYDYHAKYIDDNTQYLFDTISNAELVEKINSDAITCFNSLKCRHAARVDFVLTDDGEAYAIEINTIPGMTTHSCVPKAAAKIGISMPQLCNDIAQQALTDYRNTGTGHLIQMIRDGKKEKEKKIPQDV